jgi:hypothetical protein
MRTLEDVKNMLRSYKRSQIHFCEPHFTIRLVSREGDIKQVIDILLNPETLILFEKQSEDKYGLHFKISNTKLIILPVVFKRNKLIVLTYIMRRKK